MWDAIERCFLVQSEGEAVSVVTAEEIVEAISAWNAGIGDMPLAEERKHPM